MDAASNRWSFPSSLDTAAVAEAPRMRIADALQALTAGSCVRCSSKSDSVSTGLGKKARVFSQFAIVAAVVQRSMLVAPYVFDTV